MQFIPPRRPKKAQNNARSFATTPTDLKIASRRRKRIVKYDTSSTSQHEHTDIISLSFVVHVEAIYWWSEFYLVFTNEIDGPQWAPECQYTAAEEIQHIKEDIDQVILLECEFWFVFYDAITTSSNFRRPLAGYIAAPCGCIRASCGFYENADRVVKYDTKKRLASR